MLTTFFALSVLQHCWLAAGIASSLSDILFQLQSPNVLPMAT